jgi:hypothetical protein
MAWRIIGAYKFPPDFDVRAERPKARRVHILAECNVLKNQRPQRKHTTVYNEIITKSEWGTGRAMLPICHVCFMSVTECDALGCGANSDFKGSLYGTWSATNRTSGPLTNLLPSQINRLANDAYHLKLCRCASYVHGWTVP